MIFIVRMAARMIKMLEVGCQCLACTLIRFQQSLLFHRRFPSFVPLHVISSLPLDRSLDKRKNRWHIIRREWIVALRSRHKMLAANPRVVGWGPIFSVDRSYPPLSSLWFSRKTIETDTATFRKPIGASYGAARLAHLARLYTLTKVLPLKMAAHVTLT